MLGFSSNLYSFYKNSVGASYAAVTASETRTYNGVTKTITKITTPNALAAAQSHFGCTSITGVELEEYGGSGTAGSHWDMRLFMDDIMSPAAYWVNPGVS